MYNLSEIQINTLYDRKSLWSFNAKKFRQYKVTACKFKIKDNASTRSEKQNEQRLLIIYVDRAKEIETMFRLRYSN